MTSETKPEQAAGSRQARAKARAASLKRTLDRRAMNSIANHARQCIAIVAEQHDLAADDGCRDALNGAHRRLNEIVFMIDALKEGLS